MITAIASSTVSPPSTTAPKVSRRFSSGLPFLARKTRASTASHCAPLMRTMAMPPSPAAVACAAMVSFIVIMGTSVYPQRCGKLFIT